MILLYHLIFPDNFKPNNNDASRLIHLNAFISQLKWLKNHYRILSLEEYVSRNKFLGKNSEKSVAITFDDGYRKTFDLVNHFLLSEKIPATFFIPTNHLNSEELYWFAYFNGLCFGQEYNRFFIDGKEFSLETPKLRRKSRDLLSKLARESGDAIEFYKSIAKYYPLSDRDKENYEGMTIEQIAGASKNDIISLGGHTHHHPFLDHLPFQAQFEEMKKNKKILEEISGHSIQFFAYTGGYYNKLSIDAVKKSGFKAAFAINPKNLVNEILFEIPRIGIYSPSILKFKLKLMGFTKWIDRIKKFSINNR